MTSYTSGKPIRHVCSLRVPLLGFSLTVWLSEEKPHGIPILKYILCAPPFSHIRANQYCHSSMVLMAKFLSTRYTQPPLFAKTGQTIRARQMFCIDDAVTQLLRPSQPAIYSTNAITRGKLLAEQPVASPGLQLRP
jgi:hypothetical protein